MKRAHVERAEKQDFVTALRSTFQANASVIVAHYAGLTVSDMQALRKQAKQAGVSVKVAKNRLAKIALDGTEVASIASLLEGADASRLFERPGRRGKGRDRLCQGE